MRAVNILVAAVAFVGTRGDLAAQEPQHPEALYEAGDFYVLRDRSAVPLLRSAREIAIKRV